VAKSEAVWVFGYGSLVSPTSLGGTLGRTPIRGENFVAAEVKGWSRRWNYGIRTQPGSLKGPDAERVSVIVALGIVEATEEWMNGVLALVHPEELQRLDARERNYDRVDVTDQIRVLDDETAADSIHRAVVYVPRPVAIDIYEEARAEGRAAIEQRYWDLVDGAFEVLAPGHGERYRASTPAPAVPVRNVSRV
jgi:cation transport regulator ChaC